MRPPDSPKQDAMESVEHDRASHAGFDLENLFEVSPDAIFVTDNRGVIRAANPRAVELFGHTEDELVGQPDVYKRQTSNRFSKSNPAWLARSCSTDSIASCFGESGGRISCSK